MALVAVAVGLDTEGAGGRGGLDGTCALAWLAVTRAALAGSARPGQPPEAQVITSAGEIRRDPGASLRPMTRSFREAMRLMRSHDPQCQEEGFHQLLPHAADHLDELIAHFQQEQDDHGLRCWLLELIGAAQSPDALPLLSASTATTNRCATGQLPG